MRIAAMNAWRHPDQLSFVIASHECLSLMGSFKQDQSDKPESGGILLGHRRGDHIDIIAMTEPSPKDIRRRNFFHRRDGSHQESATRLWRESNGQIDYVGEWHTHPESHPSPSYLDLMQWRMASLRYGKPLIVVIVGLQTNFGGWLFKGRFTKLESA